MGLKVNMIAIHISKKANSKRVGFLNIVIILTRLAYLKRW